MFPDSIIDARAQPIADSLALPLEVAGARLQLLPDKAVWWAEQRTLFIADAHFGKAATFRAHGLPVPEATTDDALARLSALMTHWPVGRVVFLGDFMHAKLGNHPLVLAALRDWRTRQRDIAMTLVRGNHDSHAGDPPVDLGIDVVDEPLPLGPLAACHHPQTVPGATVLAGHWHPAVHLAGRARDHLRLPCFCHSPGLLVLPAFGAFTGGQAVRRQDGQACYAVGAGRVWRV